MRSFFEHIQFIQTLNDYILFLNISISLNTKIFFNILINYVGPKYLILQNSCTKRIFFKKVEEKLNLEHSTSS